MGIKLHTPQMRTSGSKPWAEYKRKTYPPNTAPPVTVRTVTPSTGKPLWVYPVFKPLLEIAQKTR